MKFGLQFRLYKFVEPQTPFCHSKFFLSTPGNLFKMKPKKINFLNGKARMLVFFFFDISRYLRDKYSDIAQGTAPLMDPQKIKFFACSS